jgi:hypothetical protein
MVKQQINVTAGKDLVTIEASGHKFVRLLDAKGEEIFRFDSPGEHVTAFVHPGRYTVESDGKLGKVDVGTIEPRFRLAAKLNAHEPPPLARG